MTFGKQRAQVLFFLLSPIFQIAHFSSTTMSTGMTGIFLHGTTAPKQQPPTSRLNGSKK
jgi:hypothetical protein